MKKFTALLIIVVLCFGISSSPFAQLDKQKLKCPCDIYAAGQTPCVAAHSTVRALYATYNGRLYQVTRTIDKKTKDIRTLRAGGYVNAGTQDAFCAGTACEITIIYDQSPNGNHLLTAGPMGGHPTSANNAIADALKININGHQVYGVHITPGMGYRTNTTKGTKNVAKDDEPESMYMVTSGTFYNNGCCFDYGNTENNSAGAPPGAMEAVYFGTNTVWGKGAGDGPWLMADLENGLFAGPSTARNPDAISLTYPYVTAMVKGRTGVFALKAGNAQSGALSTLYEGARPAGYTPMKKQGAIILGIGGDGSNGSQGNFFEGVMTAGYSSNGTDAAVQANIVAAGYGKQKR